MDSIRVKRASAYLIPTALCARC